MIKIEKLNAVEGVLEMQGKVEDLVAETVLIMRSLAQRLETQTGIPAADHIAGMAMVATDPRMVEAYDETVHRQPGVDLGSVIWKWGTGDEP